MTLEEQKNIAGIAIAFFDRVDMKGAELNAANAVRGMLQGLATGEFELTPVPAPKVEPINADKTAKSPGAKG